MNFRNFLAASSKRNMYSFGLFPYWRDISWIVDNISPVTPAVVASSTTPQFDLANGLIQRLTLTADVASSTITLAGGGIIDGTQFYLHILQDTTGGWFFTFPDNVRNSANYQVGIDPSTMTSFMLEYRANGWDFIAAPVEGPVLP